MPQLTCGLGPVPCLESYASIANEIKWRMTRGDKTMMTVPRIWHIAPIQNSRLKVS